MTATDLWTTLETSRGAARRRMLVRVGTPLALAAGVGLVAAIPVPPDSTQPFVAGMAAALLGTYGALTVRPARRAFERHHQVHILPRILEDAGVRLVCSPDSAPSWIALHRARLFPPAQAARPGPLLHGAVDGVFMEAGAVVLTAEKLVRKVRRVQKPVFSGAVYTVDLGPANTAGDVVILGPQARWPRAARRSARWKWLGTKGLPWGARTYARVGTSPDLPAHVVPFVADVLRAHRRARISIQDQRHLVVAVPGRAALFRPASVFAPLARDTRAARSLTTMRIVAALGQALGAPFHPPSAAQEGEVLYPSSPKAAVARAYEGHPRSRWRAGAAAARARTAQTWSWVRQHPYAQRAGAVFADMGRAFTGSAPATAASERTMEVWDGLRDRLGLEPTVSREPKVRPHLLGGEGAQPETGLDTRSAGGDGPEPPVARPSAPA